MPESLPPDRAYALASRLTLVPGFPNRDQAIQAVAEWLLANCADADQAAWLIGAALHDPQWLGIDGLSSRYDARFRPRPENRPFADTGRRPKLVCPRCNDMGVTGQPYTWCSCESGQRLRVEVPQYLRLCRETDKRIAPSPFAQDQATPPACPVATMRGSARARRIARSPTPVAVQSSCARAAMTWE